MSAIKPYEPQRTVMEEAVILLLQDLHRRKSNPKTSSVVRRKAESLLDALGAPYRPEPGNGTGNGTCPDAVQDGEAPEPDTREKLEEDIRRSLGYTVDDVLCWLDRQAAITEREITSTGIADWCQACDLQAKVDELTEQLADMERTHMKLPLDADGVPIRIGDEMEWTNKLNGEKERFTVAGYTTEYSTWTHDNCTLMATNDECAEFYCDQCRHVKPDTIESLLQDLADEVWEASCTCQTIWSDSGLDGIAERYAERIRQSIERERN